MRSRHPSVSAPAGGREPAMPDMRVRRSDSRTLEIVAELLPQMRRWAHGRLAHWARTAADTADIVHDAVVGTLVRLPSLEFPHERALGAYLLRAVQSRLRDEHRRCANRLPRSDLSDAPDPSPSPFEQMVDAEFEAQYRAALGRVSQQDRELLVAHFELNYSHGQLGCMTGRSSNAARMALRRALARLMRAMGEV